jgi:hypothetical protein
MSTKWTGPAVRDELSAIERRRKISVDEAARLRGVHPDTLLRQNKLTGKPKIYQLSQRRRGFELGEILDLP